MATTQYRRGRSSVHKIGKHSLNHLVNTYQALLESIDTPRALTISLLLRSRQWTDIVKLDLNPHNYLDHYSFLKDYQATKFLSKTAGLPTGIDTNAVALEKWWECEKSNKSINSSLSELLLDPSRDPEVCQVLHLAARKIQKILGKVDLDYIFDNSRWGPGSTLSTASDVSPCAKFENRADVSKTCLPYAIAYRKVSPHWLPLEYNVIDHNKLVFVPKTSKTDRPISIEPSMNIYFQLGAGSLIRKRLKKIDLNLDTAADKHRLLALSSSFEDDLATIDLSSASDTISSRLVLELLPDEWFVLLDDLRSKKTLLPDGSHHLNEKFSSMGNGYTFELETLIFYGLISACAQLVSDSSEISVFGDDIICGKDTARMFSRLVSRLGFSLNKEKTFIDGPFRESCGVDAFLGYNVRPYFLKGIPNDQIGVHLLANGLSEVATRFYDSRNSITRRDFVSQADRSRFLPNFWMKLLPPPFEPAKYRDALLKPAFDAAVSALPIHKRMFIPDLIGFDAGLLGSLEEIPSEHVLYLSFRPLKKKLSSDREGLLAHALYNAGASQWTDQSVTMRGRGHYVVKKRRDSFTRARFDRWF